MGADLCLSYVWAFGDIPFEKRRKKMEEYIEKHLDFNDENLFVEFMESKGDSYSERSIEEIKEMIEGTMIDFFPNIYDRDVVHLHFFGHTLICSGGMSWGDSPGDMYSTINEFTSLPDGLLEAGGFSWYNDTFDLFKGTYKDLLDKPLLNKLNEWKKEIDILEKI